MPSAIREGMKRAHVRLNGWLQALILVAWLAAGGVEVFAESGVTGSIPIVSPKKSWFKRHFGRQTVEEVLREAKQPRDVCRAVARNVGYRTEDVDRWASLQETWARGFGDCEDFASSVAILCQQLGFEAKVHLYFALGGRRDGHAVVVGIWQGRMWMSDLGSYKEVDSIEDVKDRVARNLECDPRDLWGSVLDHDGVQRFIARSRGENITLSTSGVRL